MVGTGAPGPNGGGGRLRLLVTSLFDSPADRKDEMGRERLRSVDPLGGFPEIAGSRLENVGDERLRIPIDHRKPGALYLNHEPVALREPVVTVSEADRVRGRLPRNERLRFPETVPEARAEDFAGHHHLVTTHPRI